MREGGDDEGLGMMAVFRGSRGWALQGEYVGGLEWVRIVRWMGVMRWGLYFAGIDAE